VNHEPHEPEVVPIDPEAERRELEAAGFGGTPRVAPCTLRGRRWRASEWTQLARTSRMRHQGGGRD
jgi:hypothetical protein